MSSAFDNQPEMGEEHMNSSTQGPNDSQVNRVVIVDVDMPMRALVLLLVRLAIAAIPALLLLAALGFGATLALATVGQLASTVSEFGSSLSSRMHNCSNQAEINKANAEGNYSLEAELRAECGK